jgi:hypothetical protein
MRFIARTKDNSEKIVRLMIYESPEGIYLFGFSTMTDSYCDWDTFFESVKDAKETAMIDYNVDFKDWIQIVDPNVDCQNDWIGKVKRVSKDNLTFFFSKEQNSYIDLDLRNDNFTGMTVNERLYHSGLLYEYDNSKEKDKIKTQKIMKYLNVEID